MITSRQKKILKAIIEEYVKTNEPVGSKFLASLPGFDYSSATIRNDMAELEEMGLLLKTHTSSGRIPSEEGYRVYVKDIIENNNVKEEINDLYPLIDEIFERESFNREHAVKKSMALVTDLTNYASVVLGGSAYNSKIKKLQLVALNDRFAVILMVTDQGYVESKKIIIPEEISVHDIEKVVNLLNDMLYDVAISEIDQVLKNKFDSQELLKQVEYYDELVGILVRTFSEMAQDKFFLSGKTKILSQPEFQDVEKVRELLEVMEKQDILKVINLSSNGITVKIGQDNEIKAMEDCTIISVPFENEYGEKGAIAVIGPTRMEYHKIIPLLKYIASNIKKL